MREYRTKKNPHNLTNRSPQNPRSGRLVFWVCLGFIGCVWGGDNSDRHCQNKPPCPIGLRKLTSKACPILYLFAISKPALRSSNLQLCCMWDFHKYIVKINPLFSLYYFWQKTRVSKRVSKTPWKLNFLQFDWNLYFLPARKVIKLSTIGHTGLSPNSQARLKGKGQMLGLISLTAPSRSSRDPCHRGLWGTSGHPNPRWWHSNRGDQGHGGAGLGFSQSGSLLGMAQGYYARKRLGYKVATPEKI